MTKIEEIENKMMKLSRQLSELKKKQKKTEVKNYSFLDQTGKVSLLDMFADKKKLFVIHNMGQGCRYCTLWADGLNGFLPHLENEFSVVLVSKDSPEEQRKFANSRNWRYRMASHGGGKYIVEQTVSSESKNAPGVVFYERQGDKIYRKNAAAFGPYDLYCSVWNFLSLAGRNDEDWTPQYNYWSRPKNLDDGGQNLE